MKNTLTRLKTRIFDTPLCIQPKKLEVILAAIGDRIGLEVSEEQKQAAASFTKADPARQYDVVDGIAVIPITGSLMKSCSGLMAESGCSSYETIQLQIEDALTAPNVDSIVLDVDSPGGEVSGMFDLADFIYSNRSVKPIVAIANESAFSAAYALASSAETLYITRTGGVGSIGVFQCHIDQSEADRKEGLKYTYIHAGAKKTDGNPHEPLSDTALKETQAEIDRIYGMFCQLVSRNRGINLEAVINTEAGCYFAENAIPLLADKISNLQDVLASLGQQDGLINTSVRKTTGTTTMTENEKLITSAEAPCDKSENYMDDMEVVDEAKAAKAEDTSDDAPADEPTKKDKEDKDDERRQR